MEQFKEIAGSIAEEAVSYAKKSGIELDYTVESAKNADVILGAYHDNIERYDGEEGKKTLSSVAVMFGAYIGEMLLREGLSEKGFAWTENKGFPILSTQDGKITASPITKVQKRIINGAGDGIESFVNVVFAAAEGSLPKTGILRVPDVETAGGVKAEKVVFKEADYYISLVSEGMEDFVIFKSHDGFFQFYGFGDSFVCEVWFNIGGNRAYMVINTDCKDTERTELITPFGRYTPRKNDVITLKQLREALLEYFQNIEERDFLERVPHESIDLQI